MLFLGFKLSFGDNTALKIFRAAEMAVRTMFFKERGRNNFQRQAEIALSPIFYLDTLKLICSVLNKIIKFIFLLLDRTNLI